MVIVWKNLSHPNVVPLLGVTTDPIQLILGSMPDIHLLSFEQELSSRLSELLGSQWL